MESVRVGGAVAVPWGRARTARERPKESANADQSTIVDGCVLTAKETSVDVDEGALLYGCDDAGYFERPSAHDVLENVAEAPGALLLLEWASRRSADLGRSNGARAPRVVGHLRALRRQEAQRHPPARCERMIYWTLDKRRGSSSRRTAFDMLLWTMGGTCCWDASLGCFECVWHGRATSVCRNQETSRG